MKRIIGIDIGRKKCSVIHADFDGNGFRILQKVIFLLEADYNTAELAIERLDELLHMYDFDQTILSHQRRMMMSMKVASCAYQFHRQRYKNIV